MGATHEAVVCAQRKMRPTMHVALLLVVSVSAFVEIPGTFTATGGQINSQKVRRSLRRYSSASASSYGSAAPSSSYTSAVTPVAAPTASPKANPTAAPTSQPMTPTVIKQKLTLSISATEFAKPEVKNLLVLSYATEMGMYDAIGKAWISPFNSKSVSVAIATRRTISVEYTTTIADATAAATVKTKSKGLTKAKMSAAITKVKSNDSTFAAVSAPTVATVAAPTITDPVVDPCAAPVVCAATGTTITSMWAAVVVGAVVLLRH